jgi:hypothetical protein
MTKYITGDKKILLMVKGSTNQENITVINIHVPNRRVIKYIQEKLTAFEGETNKPIFFTHI